MQGMNTFPDQYKCFQPRRVLGKPETRDFENNYDEHNVGMRRGKFVVVATHIPSRIRTTHFLLVSIAANSRVIPLSGVDSFTIRTR